MQFYVAVVLGCLLFLLFQLNKAYKKPDFSWFTFFKTIWIPALINFVIGFVIVWAREDIEAIYPVTVITAFATGIAGQAILKGIFEASNKDVATVIGTGE